MSCVVIPAQAGSLRLQARRHWMTNFPAGNNQNGKNGIIRCDLRKPCFHVRLEKSIAPEGGSYNDIIDSANPTISRSLDHAIKRIIDPYLRNTTMPPRQRLAISINQPMPAQRTKSDSQFGRRASCGISYWIIASIFGVG